MGYQLRQIAKRIFPRTPEQRKRKREMMEASRAARRGFGVGPGLVKKLLDEKMVERREQSSRMAARDVLEAKAAAKRARRRNAMPFGDGRPPGSIVASHPEEIARLQQRGLKVRASAYTPPKVRHAQVRG